MPEKRPSALIDNPPDASSSDDEEMEEVVEKEEKVKGADNNEEEEDEEEEEEEEEEDEEEEDEEEEEDGDDSRFTVKKSDPNPQPQSSSLGEEEESDSESESDSDLPPENTKSIRAVNTVIDPTVKPITSVPMDVDAKHNKKSTEKPKPATPSKRPAKTTTTTTTTDKQDDSKRRKKSGGSDGEESEKKSSNKLWSEDDEVVILKGMVSLIKKGVKPTSDKNVLLEHIKTGLHVDVTKDQLHNKVRRLKQKYQTNAKKEAEEGEEQLHFSRTHDSKCYELSKKVWGEKDAKVEGTEASNGGGGGGGVDSVKKEVKSRNRKPKLEIRNEVLSTTLAEQTPNLSSPSPSFNEIIDFGKNSIVPPEGLKGFLAKEALVLIGSSKAKALEEKWRKLQVAEARIYLDRIELVREQVKMVLDALDSPEE